MEIPLLKKDVAIHYHVQLELPDKRRETIELVFCKSWVRGGLGSRAFGPVERTCDQLFTAVH